MLANNKSDLFYLSISRSQELLNSCCLVPAEILNCIVQVIVARTWIVIMYKIWSTFSSLSSPFTNIYIYMNIMNSEAIFKRCCLEKMEIIDKAKPLYKSKCKFFFIIPENVLLLLEDIRPVNTKWPFLYEPLQLEFETQDKNGSFRFFMLDRVNLHRAIDYFSLLKLKLYMFSWKQTNKQKAKNKL